MSRQDPTIISNLEILLLKGDKGDTGESYDDTELRNEIRSQNARIDDLEALVNSFDGTMILEDMATLEQTSTSTHDYDVGDYLIYNSQFYRVTASISIGDTIAEGTNVTPATVAEALDLMAEKQFNAIYGLDNKTTVINKDASGNVTSIVETNAEAVCTTTFSTSGTTTTVTTTIVPTSGSYDYTKTAVIETVSAGIQITESYSTTPKV